MRLCLFCCAVLGLVLRFSDVRTARGQALSKDEVASLISGIERSQSVASGKAVKAEGITDFYIVLNGRDVTFQRPAACMFDGLHGNRLKSLTYLLDEKGVPCRAEFGVTPKRRVSIQFLRDTPTNANLNCKKMNDRPVLDLNFFAGPVIAYGNLTHALTANESFLVAYVKNAKGIVHENRSDLGDIVVATATEGQWESQCIFRMEPSPHCVEYSSWHVRDNGSKAMRRITITYADQGGILVPSKAVRTISEIKTVERETLEVVQLRSKTVYASVGFHSEPPDSEFLPAVPNGIPVLDNCNKVAIPQQREPLALAPDSR